MKRIFPKCPQCGRTYNILYRIRTDTFWCRSCGCVWREKKQNEEVQDENKEKEK